MKIHSYKTCINWTGNTGTGTSAYRAYERSHELSVENKTAIHLSSDPSFLGDRAKYNPEELFLASLSSCHMLWYLHLCAEAGIVVAYYKDEAMGEMEENENGGRFISVILNPRVVITDPEKIEEANHLHLEANRKCFIANSCNFQVKHAPVCTAR